MANRKAPPGTHRREPASETWDTLPWRKLERHVFRIQKRIYQARQRGNIRAVQKLQKLLMKSEAARLLAVRRATQGNKGQHGTRIEGTHRVYPRQRLVLAQQIHPRAPAKRAQSATPTTAAKRRGLSAPLEKARQALVSMVLEPEWEAAGAPGSVRSALEAVSRYVCDRQCYVLVASLQHGFAPLNHKALLAKLRASAGVRRIIRAWLKAGTMQDFTFTPATNGTPREDLLSALLAQIALHGMEQAVTTAQDEESEQPTLIGYADHFVLLHSRLAAVERATGRIETWLGDLGLHLDPAQTYITHTLTPYKGKAGFHFSGYFIRQYPAGRVHGRPTAYKTVIKPGKEAVRKHLEATGKRIRELRAVSQEKLISEINPLIEEWSRYYGLARSSDEHARCDHILHQQLLSWARYRHPKKGMAWLIAKYWPDVREDRHWTFRSEHSCMRRHRETPVARPICQGEGNTGPCANPLFSRSQQHELTLPQSLSRPSADFAAIQRRDL